MINNILEFILNGIFIVICLIPAIVLIPPAALLTLIFVALVSIVITVDTAYSLASNGISTGLETETAHIILSYMPFELAITIIIFCGISCSAFLWLKD